MEAAGRAPEPATDWETEDEAMRQQTTRFAPPNSPLHLRPPIGRTSAIVHA